MLVKDVMNERAATCRPHTNLAEATALMWEHDCGSLPVITDDETLAGIVTDRDICIALGTRNVRASDLTVNDLIRNHTLTCTSSDDVQAALQVMRDGKVRRLPVVDAQGHLAGIVSMDDLVLSAEQDGKGDSTVAYGDVVATLQAIYNRHDLRDWPIAA